MTFSNPDTYPICDKCKKTLRRVTALYESGEIEDSSDTEAPIDFMYDHGMFCGGMECRPDLDPAPELQPVILRCMF